MSKFILGVKNCSFLIFWATMKKFCPQIPEAKLSDRWTKSQYIGFCEQNINFEILNLNIFEYNKIFEWRRSHFYLKKMAVMSPLLPLGRVSLNLSFPSYTSVFFFCVSLYVVRHNLRPPSYNYMCSNPCIASCTLLMVMLPNVFRISPSPFSFTCCHVRSSSYAVLCVVL